MKPLNEVVVVSMARTPIGSFRGAFKHLSAIDLGIIATKAALTRSNIQLQAVDEVIFGNVLSAGLGQAPARQVALGAGLSPAIPCTTVNKVCASGMKSVQLGAMNIKLGDTNVCVVGGFESMSNVPHYGAVRNVKKYGDFELKGAENPTKMIDGLAWDGLTDPYEKLAMGTFGVRTANKFKISREEQDKYALRSYSLAMANPPVAQIIPVAVEKAGQDKLTLDEEVATRAKGITAESLSKLKGAFSDKDFEKSVTAGNSSPMSDGAACLVLASKAFCQEKGISYLCELTAWADAETEPQWFTIAPALAINKLLSKTNKTVDNLDVIEINEAFAVVPLAVCKELGISWQDLNQKVNIWGGAVSMGHPLGMSGARIIMQLIEIMQNGKQKTGVAGICNGGGGASAVMIQNVAPRSYTSKL